MGEDELTSGSLSPRERAGVREDRTFIEIPASFQAIKSADMALALKLRMETRGAFEEAFAHGLTAIDLIRDVETCRYVLCPNKLLPR